MPASDVYAWAKAATKPSYNFGEIGAGVATIGDGTNRIMWRTNASYASGVYYSTPANESVVFANKLNVTSWMFVTGDPTAQASWQTFTPSLQIKNQRVTINKAIATGTDAEYNLDVNGSFNATSGYINKNAIIHAGNIGSQSVSYATSASSANTATSATSATSATTAKRLLTNNTSQGGDACYDETPGLHFYRYNGDKTGSNDGFIMQWSWNSGSVGGQIFLDDNPSKTMMIRGRNNDANKTFTNTWATFLHSENYTTYTVTKTGTGASGTWGINISGNAATATSATSATTATTASSATTAASADVATIARSLGTDNSIKAYAQYSNEFNFGGTSNSSDIYFGYRAVDSKPIPTAFIFGSSNGTATLTASGYKKKDSSNSYVLLGGGGHKAVSDFATSGHTHSQYLTSLPSHNHDSVYSKLGHTHSYASSSHTHSYAGSSSAGGAATSANKLNTNAGGVYKPVYFTNGVPTACTYGFNGAYGMPVVLAAGYIYKSSYTSTTWTFNGTYCPALTGGITTSVSGGVLAVTWTAASGRSRYIYGAVANMRTSGAVTSYSGTEYKDRSLGMYWLGTATSTSTTYIRAMSQGDQNNDTGMSYDEMWGTSSEKSDHCILSFSIIVIGYWS